MSELTKPERTVINQLLDHAVFTASITPDTKPAQAAAITAFARPSGKRKVNGWFQNMFGTTPLPFQDNLLWLQGPDRLSEAQVAVLLATLKAIINMPEVQQNSADRVVAVQPVVTAVHSVVPQLDEVEIAKVIADLFENRLGLLTADQPETSGESVGEVEEFWDVDVDFVAVANLLVQAIAKPQDSPKHTDIQRANIYLLKHRYLAKATQPDLFAVVQANAQAIAAAWADAQRFYLEVGDDYAMLLDATRRQKNAKQYFVALAVAHTLGAGLADDALGPRIRQVCQQLYPNANINQTLVKDELRLSALAYQHHGYWQATPIAKRYAISTEGSDDYAD